MVIPSVYQYTRTQPAREWVDQVTRGDFMWEEGYNSTKFLRKNRKGSLETIPHFWN